MSTLASFNVVAGALTALSLLAGMILLIELGRRLGIRAIKTDPENARTGLGVIDSAVFALVGLLVAFTFSGAAGRFDARRALVTQECNAIGTAWLRLDTLPDADRDELRSLFRSYVDSRLEVYRRVPDMQAVNEALSASSRIQTRIWERAIAATRPPELQRSSMLLMPSLNEMFDIASTRTAAASNHPPVVIFGLLCGMMLVSALLAGFGMAGAKKRSIAHILVFALTLAVSMYVIIDLEYPRIGIIRVDDWDRFLVDLRNSMG